MSCALCAAAPRLLHVYVLLVVVCSVIAALAVFFFTKDPGLVFHLFEECSFDYSMLSFYQK